MMSKKMRRTIFYSWQSDLPDDCNHRFIQAALESSAKIIAADETVSIEPVIDRDTQGVPGSPDIATTIFAKIAAADIFVADVSFITREEGSRAFPNPNVLVELGYALKALGFERVLLVFNNAYGKVEELPFDLRSKSILTYHMAEVPSATPVSSELEKKLVAAIVSTLDHLPSAVAIETPVSKATRAIEEQLGNRSLRLSEALGDILSRIDVLEPKKCIDGGTADDLITGIDSTMGEVADFSRLAYTIAMMNDEACAIQTVRWFGLVFERYRLPVGYLGRASKADQDFFKFLGHEMFVTLFAFLIRNQKWEMVRTLVGEPFYLRNWSRNSSGSIDWKFASEHVLTLLEESQAQRRISLHGDLLRKRHSGSGGLAAILPLEDLMEADFFLFLLSRITTIDGEDSRSWRAWSCLNLTEAPAFIRQAEHRRYAERLAKALGTNGVDEFKSLLRAKGQELAKLFGIYWDYPITKDDIERVGTRQP